ncbi:hypothetical protein OG21DRAFT_1518202 [Imleria badia]|nr:hypothetical protein OG21DRAFT_1518202 [Imleria badia]
MGSSIPTPNSPLTAATSNPAVTSSPVRDTSPPPPPPPNSTSSIPRRPRLSHSTPRHVSEHVRGRASDVEAGMIFI